MSYNKNVFSGLERPEQEQYRYRAEIAPQFASPLHKAAAQGDIDSVTKLVDKNIIQPIDLTTATPLHLAVEHAFAYRRSFLMASYPGKPIEEINTLVEEDITIIIGQLTSMYPYLINAPCEGGWRALHLAAMHGSTAIVNELILAGADIHQVNDGNYTALHLAIHHKQDDVTHLLLSRDAVATPLLHANNLEVLDGVLNKHPELIHYVDAKGNTLLHLAATFEDDRSETIQYLIEHGIPLNPLNKEGETALDIIMKSENEQGTLVLARAGALTADGDTLLHVLVTKKINDSIEIVLKTPGIAVNTKNTQGQTALTLAIHNRELDIAKLIIPRTTEDDRLVGLREIISSDAYATDVAQTIIAHLSPEIIRQNADLLVNLAIQHNRNDLVNNLLGTKHRSDSQTRPMSAASESRIELIHSPAPTATDADINKANKQGKTALHLACEQGDLEAVSTLTAQADVKFLNAVDQDGNTALHLAANALESVIILGQYQANADPQEAIITILVEKSADRRIKNESGKTALHIAAAKGNHTVVKTLLEPLPRAYIHNVNNAGNTPLHLAAKGQNETLVKLLLEKGADPQTKNKKGKKPLALAGKNEIKQMLAQQDLIVALQNHKTLLEKELNARFGFFARYSAEHDFKNNKRQKIEAIDALLTHLVFSEATSAAGDATTSVEIQPVNAGPTDLSSYIGVLLDGRTGDILRDYDKTDKDTHDYSGCWPSAFKTAVKEHLQGLSHTSSH